MSDSRPTVLVTGGAGYIGAHACKALHRAGYDPVVFDNHVYGHESSVRWGPHIKADLNDPDSVSAAIEETEPDAIMHFAAYAYVGESVQNPGKYYQNNVAGTLNLLDAMRDAGIRKLIFSSTCATYGEPDFTPITEDHPQRPINPYGRTKLMMEQILQDYRTAHGIRSVSLRYFNAAGADPDGEIGEDHDPETHLIPLVLFAALGLRPSIKVFGSDYATPDGTCIRDYIHVTDLAQAHVLALQALAASDPRPAYNLGNGSGFSVREVIDCCKEITGLPIAVEEAPRRPGDPAVLVGDATLAREELGWEPRYADLREIVRTAWTWTQARFSNAASEAPPLRG